MQRMLLILAASSLGQWHPDNDQIKQLWPAEIDMPANLAFYSPTRYSQRLAITNGRDTNHVYHLDRDDVWGNSPTSYNPNRSFPYRVPGGLHVVPESEWQSYLGVSFPDDKNIEVWTERVPVTKSERDLPKRRWAFPSGTIFADLLVKDGKPFELRLRKKRGALWESSVAYKNAAEVPKGYSGAGMACVDCHKRAGASEQYGITVRGDDGNFSFPVLREGTLETNRQIFEGIP